MRAWQCLGHCLCADCACSVWRGFEHDNMLHVVYGIVLVVLAVYEEDACMRRWLANRWNWRRRSGRGYLCPPGHALSYNPHLPQPAAGAKCILYFFPNANYSNPKQLSLKSSYTPPKSSYANPSLLSQSSAATRRGIVLKSILLNYPRPIHYSQKKLGGVYLFLATPQRCASQLFNQDYSKTKTIPRQISKPSWAEKLSFAPS